MVAYSGDCQSFYFVVNSPPRTV